MMDHAVGHLVRRCMDAHASYRAGASAGMDPQEPSYKMPVWGIVVLAGTAMVFMAFLSMIEYTYGHLVAALSMIESPTAEIYEHVVSDDVDAPLDSKKNGSVEAELILVKQAPITAKLRTAVRHLHKQAGFWSRFRGLSIWVAYHFLFARLTDAFSYMRVPIGLNAVLAAVLLARLRMGWTHIIMSDPSPKYWYQRLPSWNSWKKVALPTAILAICEQVTIALPIGLWFAFGLSRFHDPQNFADLNNAERKLVILKGLAVILLGLFSAVAIVVPATVSLTRVHASLISEEEETIVPFDRSFGGRVVPVIVGGSGVIGMLDAWKTFDWNSRVRLLKLYGKVIAMQTVVFVILVTVLSIQLHLIMGAELERYVTWVRASMN